MRESQMDFNPVLLPYSDAWTIHSFRYRGSVLDLEMTPNLTTVTVTSQEAEDAEMLVLTMPSDGRRFELEVGVPLSYPPVPAVIVTASEEPLLPGSGV